jgi:hypothetical protein
MSDFEQFGQNLRELLRGLLALGKEAEKETKLSTLEENADKVRAFEENFFYGEVNRFVGSGGEALIKGERNRDAPSTRIDVGDRFIGVGVSHLVESLSRPPGPDTFRALNLGPGSGGSKIAARAFEVARKDQTQDGFDLTLSPLSPTDYSELLERVSGGLVKVPAESIPDGTMILSFIDPNPTYTLRTMAGSPGMNWAEATKGERHWNVGISNPTDFWIASLPSDDVGMLSEIPSFAKVGSMRFGLSLLPGSRTNAGLNTVPCIGPSGETTLHHFCLSGTVVGTQGFSTPFPIGLRTEIIFHPEK